MGQEKGKSNNTVIKELKAKMRILEEERNTLTGQAEVFRLFSLISDLLITNDKIPSIIENSLEQIALFKNLPLCCLCSLEKDKVVPVHLFPKTVNESKSKLSIQAGKRIIKEIAGSSRVYKLSDTKSIKIKNIAGKKENSFSHVLFIPFKTDYLPDGIIIIADNKKSNRLAGINTMLRPILNMVADKIDKIILSSGRKEIKKTSDKKIFKPGRLNDISPVDSLSHNDDIREKLLNNEGFNSITEQLTDVIFLTDSRGKIIYISHAAVNLFGWVQKEMIGKNFTSFLSKTEIPKAIAAFIEAMKNKNDTKNLTVQMKRKDGSLFYGELNATVYPLHSGSGTQGVIRDITERLRLEEDLLIKERAIITSFDGVVISNLTGRLTYVNDSFQKMWGYTNQESLKLNITDLDSDKREINLIVKEIKAQGFSVGESIAKRKDGSLFNIQYSANLITSNSGQPIAMLSTFVDITERKRSEEKLKKSENLMRMILEGTPYLFFYTQDTQAKITYISPSVERITGHPIQEWYDQTHWFITDNKINDYAKEKTHAHMRGEFTKGSILVEVEHSNKYPILLEIFENPIILNGKVVGLQGVAHDITERKRAEDALKESEEIFSQFMEHSPYYVFFKDSMMRSLRLSKNYESMLGRPLNNLLNKSMDELFPSDLAKKMVADDLKILKEGKQFDIEEELNGCFYSTIKFPIYHNGEPRYLAGYTIDITDRKRAEQILLSQNNYLNALNETTLDLISQLNLAPLLENIVTRAGQLVGSDSGFLAMVAPENTHLITKIQTGFFASGKTSDILYPGEGLAGKVWQSGQPLIIDNYSTWQGRLTIPDMTLAGSIMAVPLFSGEKVIGVLGIAHECNSNLHFNQDDLPRLNLFARFATIAVENAKLYSSSNEELTERKNAEKLLHDQNDYLKALQETTLDLISQLDLNLLLDKIVRRALQFIGTSSGFLAVPTPDGTKLIEKIKIGIFDSEKDLVAISPGEGLVGRVWQSGQPMVLDDYNSWPGRRKDAKLVHPGSIMALPLFSGSKIVGVLGLAFEKESNKFFDREILDKLNLFARFATIAIENAQLYSEANLELQERKRTEELLYTQNDYLKALQETSLDLISQLDLDLLLESIVNRAGQFIGASSGFLSLPSTDGSYLICKIETNFIERVKAESIILPGEGLAGKVWQSGKPIIVEDYSKWPERRLEGVKYTGSSLAVPLYSGTTLVGVLGFANENSSNKIFTQESLEKLTMFARFATIAIENAQLFSEANKELQERRIAEKALMKSESEYRNLFESANDAILIFEPETENILEANNKACEIYGFSKDEFIGMSLKSLTKNVELGQIQIQHTLQEQRYKNFETQHFSRDGKIIDFLVNATLIEYKDKTAILSINHDVTDRKRSEDRLRSQNEYLKILHETSLDFIKQLDLDPLLESIVNRAGQFINATSGSLSLVSEDGTHLICKIETNLSGRKTAESIIYPGEGLVGKVWQTGQPMFVDDYSQWPGKLFNPDVEYAGSSMAVPLFSGSSIIGVLNFASEQSSNSLFNQESLDRLVMFARFATIAIENAQLFAKANRELNERKLAEEALRESEEKFRTMFNQSPIGIELYDSNGFQIAANKASLDMFGIPDFSELQNFNIFDGTSLTEEIKTKLRNRQPITYQAAFDFDKVNKLNQYKTDKTGIAYLDYTITPISGVENNSNLGYLLHVQDITERKFAEKEINMLAQSLRSINECVTITDIENNLIFVNQSFLNTYGFTEEELIGKNISIVGSSKNPPEIFDEILQATFNGGWLGETINTRKNGSEFPISLSTSVIKDKEGKILGLVGVSLDITERKRAEEEIKILAHSLKSINECVSITDNENKLLFVNQCFLDTYGYTEEELIGKNISIVGTSDITAEIRGEILQATLDGGWFGEMINVRKDKTKFPISLSTSVIKDKDGGILGLIGVAQDITERKKTEEEIKISNEELLTLNRIITESANQLDSRLLLQTALDEALQICGLEGGTVCIITPDQKLHLAVERNTSEAAKSDLPDNNFIIGECLCGNCAIEQKPLILNTRKEILKYSTGEVKRGKDIRFHAAFPIVAKGISIGVLCVFTNTDNKPSPRSLKLIETMTSQLALTLENANLYEQIQKQLVDLEEEISERKFYADNLRKNEKNLSITLNSIGDAVISTDEDGCVVRMNPVAEKLCGWKYEDARGKSLSEVFKIINAYTRMPIPNPVKLVMETGKIIGMANHTVLLSKDGFEYQIADSAAPIKSEDGKILGIVLVFSDVTEKYSIQEALKVSEATLVKAELFGKFGNWEFNLAAKTITASKGALEIYGLNEDKYDLEIFHNLVLPEFRTLLDNSLEKLIKENTPYDVEYKIERGLDGEIVDIHSSARINYEIGIVFGVIQDITERKRAEEKLVESEDRYKRITDGLTDYLISVKVKDGKAIETIHNEACLAVTGYTQEEFLSDPYLWIKIVVPEDQQAVGQRFFNILNGKEFPTIEHRIICKNGNIRWISDAAIPKYDSNGLLISYDGVIKDITERKLAEDQLRNSEKEYRNLFEHASDSILIFEPENGSILEVNTQACNTYGFSKEEFINKGLKDISSNYENDMQFIRDILNGAEIHNYEALHLKKDGTTIYGLISASLIKYKGQKAIQSFFLDITERKRAEQEIISQRNNFEQLFINSPIAIAIMDQYDHIIHINQAFTNLFGYSVEEAAGYDLNELVVPSIHREEGVLLSRQAHIGRPISKESFRQKKDGSMVFVQIAGIPIEINDRRIGIYAMYIDLTHRMRAEQETIRSREIAEQSNKMKSEFLAQISHEIRSPINIITSNISLINEDMKDKIGSDVQDCFNSIYFATKRIIRTIDLILNMSELQTGSYRPILTTVDIDSKVLQLLFGEFQKPAKDKGIELIYRNELKVTRIFADEYSITQIFANLIDNAVKYTKKGSVEIVLTKNKDKNTMVEVKDTGIGINKDFLPQLFEPFIQEEQGYTRSFEGNGLGLSLVKKYCEINNAKIEYESEKNVGSIFRVIFYNDN